MAPYDLERTALDSVQQRVRSDPRQGSLPHPRSRQRQSALFRERVGNCFGLERKGLHTHSDKAVVAEDSYEIENPTLAEHRFDTSIRGIGHIALVEQLLR